MIHDTVIPIIAGSVGGLVGGVIGMYGSKWAIQYQTRAQREKEQQKHIQDQLMAYDKLWRFLKASNTRWLAHPASHRAKQYTHWFTLDSYEWLHKHFEQSGDLLSLEIFNLYLDLLKKDNLGMGAHANGGSPSLIMANYMKLQDEAGQMCAKLRKLLDMSE